MNKLAIIGYPLLATRSPEIHNKWLGVHDINGEYMAIPLQTLEFEEFFKRKVSYAFKGINITSPYKTKVIDYLDEMTAEAARTNSVNTLLIKGKKLIGHNTDIYGFQKQIEGISFLQKRILIIGAGGVAKSVAYVLQGSADIMNRTDARAIEVAQKFNLNTRLFDLNALRLYDIIINCTNKPIFAGYVPLVGQKLIDLNYGNMLNNYAPEVIKGDKMLLFQAAKAFSVWFNVPEKKLL